MKIYICTPSNRAWSPLYGMSLLNLLAGLRKAGISHGYECRTGVSLLPSGRHEQLRTAIAAHCTHALMIDDDMQFSWEALEPMLPVAQAMGDDLAMIAANYVTKPGSALIQPTARDIAGDPLYSSRGPLVDVECVSKVGLGFALINLEFLKKVPRPWFECPWVWGDAEQNYGDNMGEDYFFCEQITAAGGLIAISHLASKHVGHIGEKVYTESDICNPDPELTFNALNALRRITMNNPAPSPSRHGVNIPDEPAAQAAALAPVPEAAAEPAGQTSETEGNETSAEANPEPSVDASQSTSVEPATEAEPSDADTDDTGAEDNKAEDGAPAEPSKKKGFFKK